MKIADNCSRRIYVKNSSISRTLHLAFNFLAAEAEHKTPLGTWLSLIYKMKHVVLLGEKKIFRPLNSKHCGWNCFLGTHLSTCCSWNASLAHKTFPRCSFRLFSPHSLETQQVWKVAIRTSLGTWIPTWSYPQIRCMHFLLHMSEKSNPASCSSYFTVCILYKNEGFLIWKFLG